MSKRFRVQNVGGVRDITVDLEVGVNLLSGPNGAGKTSLTRAITRAAGGDVDLEVRDGAEHGSVDGPGVHLTIRNVVRSSGAAEVEIADVGSLAQLIDPGIIGSDAANRARVRALLALVRLPVDDANVTALAAADGEVIARALAKIRKDGIDDLLRASEAVRTAAHNCALDQERAADLAELQRSTAEHAAALHANRLEALGGRTPIPADVAQQQVRDLELGLVRAQEGYRGRLALEQAKAEASAVAGDRPDLDSCAKVLGDLDDDLRELDGKMAEMRRELDIYQERRENKAEEMRRAHLEAAATRQRLIAWQKRQELLDRPVEGPTIPDVAAAERHLDQVRRTLDAARVQVDLDARSQEAAIATKAGEDARNRCAALRETATTVGERLGELLAGTDAAGLTVVAGRLCAVIDGEPRDFATRLSDGERVKAALGVAAKCYRGKVVPLDPAFWGALDDANREIFARTAAELSLYIITEEATGGRGVTVAHLGGEA